MHFGGNVVSLACQVVLDGVLDGNRFVFAGMEQKGRGGPLADLTFIGKFLDEAGIGILAEQVSLTSAMGEGAIEGDHWVTENGKVRP